MGRPTRETCRRCERHVEECGPLSARGRCRDCGVGRFEQNADELHAHSGGFFDHWRRRTLAAFGVIVPEPEASERD